MEQNPPWEANSHSASQEILHFLRNLKVLITVFTRCRLKMADTSRPNSYVPLPLDVVVFLWAVQPLHPVVCRVSYPPTTPGLLSLRASRTGQRCTSVGKWLLSPLQSHSDWLTCLRLTGVVFKSPALNKSKHVTVWSHAWQKSSCMVSTKCSTGSVALNSDYTCEGKNRVQKFSTRNIDFTAFLKMNILNEEWSVTKVTR